MKVSRRKGFWESQNAEKKNRVRERERYEIAHWIWKHEASCDFEPEKFRGRTIAPLKMHELKSY